MRPCDFWALTYAEFIAVLHGYQRLERHKTNELLYLAWHTAALSRQDRLPSLQSLLHDDDQPQERREQTPEEMMAMARMLNAAYGGTEVEAHGDL